MKMNLIKFIKDIRKTSLDPVKHCLVYKSVGCAHVDGMLCDIRTCDIKVLVEITPNLMREQNEPI